MIRSILKNTLVTIARLSKQNWVLVLLIAAIVLYWLAFFMFYGKIPQFVFPFDANIYGTLSDWAMVLITAVTAYYLWKTLQSQTEVHRMQQGLLDIEEYKFFQSIKPDFTFEFECKAKHNYTGPKEIEITLNLPCVNHKAIDVEISASYTFQSEGMTHFPSITEPAIEVGEKYEIFEKETFRVPANNRFHMSIDVLLTYNDVNKNNRYQKQFSFENSLASPFNFNKYVSPSFHIWKRDKEQNPIQPNGVK